MLKRLLPLALLAVAGAATYLAARGDWPLVARTVAAAGWTLLVVIALHLPQTLASAWCWRALSPAGAPSTAPSLGRSYVLRWVRDSVNTLLPVAQVGGDVVRVRLVARGEDGAVAGAAATTIVDVALEVLAQVAFTVGAVLLLLVQTGFASGAASRVAIASLIGCAVITAALLALRRWGSLARLEAIAARRLWPGSDRLAGIGAAMAALHARPRRLAASFAMHVVAWTLGAVETWAALRVIGADPGFGAAVVIEALGHAARAVGFFVPGSLGIQEGGYVLVCGLYGVAAPAALSLSVIKRIREVALGLPGLLAWAWLERGTRRAGANMTGFS